MKNMIIKTVMLIIGVILIIGIWSVLQGEDDKKVSVDKSVSVPNDTEAKTDTTTAKDDNPYDQENNFTKSDLDSSKQVAEDFVRAYHSFNAEKPQENIENSKPYMTEKLYETQKKLISRGTLSRSLLTVNEITVTPVSNASKEHVEWNVIVTGEAKSTDNEVSETEDWYLVKLRKLDQEWKVEDVKVNVPN